MTKSLDFKEAVKSAMKSHAVSRFTAEEIVQGQSIQTAAAQAEWIKNKPALVASARATFHEEIKKGGANAERRALRAARKVWSGFESRMA